VNLLNSLKISRDDLTVGFFFALFLLFQYIFPADVQYSSESYLAFFGQLQVFVGLGIGQIAAFLFERVKGKRPFGFLALAIWIFVCLVLTRVFPAQSWFFAIAAFSGFGFNIGFLYSNFSLKRIVVVSGIVGLSAALLFPFISQTDTRWLSMAGLSFFLIAHLITSNRSRFIYLIVGIVFNFPFVMNWMNLRPRMTGILEPGFSFFGEPMFSPMLRTEVIHLPDGTFRILTNGSRLAQIPTMPTESPTFTAPILKMGAIAKDARVLVIGSAGGRNIRELLNTDVGEIVANDINPNVFKMVRERFGKQTNFVYDNPRVKTVAMDARRLLQIDSTSYDFIFIETLATATRAGAFAGFVEASMYTLEAFELMYKRLKPGGRIIFSEYVRQFRGQPESESFINLMHKSLLCHAEFDDANVWIEDATLAPSQISRIASNRSKELGTERQILHIMKPLSKRSDMQSRDKSLAYSGAQTGTACENLVTDDRPFFLNMRYDSDSIKTVLIMGICALLILFTILRWHSRTSTTESAALMAGGACYTIGVTAISGIIAFQMASPFHVNPFILGLTFSMGIIAFSLFGYLVRNHLAPLFIVALASISAYFLFHGHWPEIQSLDLKIATLSALTFMPMLIFELPFLYLLKASEQKSESIAFENLGAIAGVLFSVSMRGLVGYSTLFIIAFVLAIMVFAYLFWIPRRS
jgi:SAM-dependent methyltransferase